MAVPLSPAERERIAAAIQAAEAATDGEIVCVCAEAASTYGWPSILVPAALALLTPWGLLWTTNWPVTRLLAAQVIVLLVGLAVLSIDAVRVALTPRRARRAAAHRLAAEQFYLRRVGATRGRTGLLLFVSRAERYARILVDDGIAAKIPQIAWQSAIDTLVAEARQGRLADGFVAAVATCGTLLATHVPRTGAPDNELPDRVFVI